MTLILPIKVETRNDGIDLHPQRGSKMAVGYDLRANTYAPWSLKAGETHLFPTGVKINMSAMPNMVAMVYPRSGLGVKQGLLLANGTGVVDPDYQGEIFVALWNRNLRRPSDRTIMPGDRIAQIVFLPVLLPSLVPVAEFDGETERGANGFGSTGVK